MELVTTLYQMKLSMEWCEKGSFWNGLEFMIIHMEPQLRPSEPVMLMEVVIVML
jgi:hypothetical protein